MGRGRITRRCAIDLGSWVGFKQFPGSKVSPKLSLKETIARACPRTSLPRLLIFAVVLLVGGCVTNDFKVVDALKIGMSQDEAQTVIRAYGFSRAETLQRPAGGWPSERKAFVATDWRAGREESRAGQRISKVDFYPVGHGLFGAGQLFLFFGEDGRLVNFYRYQIN